MVGAMCEWLWPAHVYVSSHSYFVDFNLKDKLQNVFQVLHRNAFGCVQSYIDAN